MKKVRVILLLLSAITTQLSWAQTAINLASGSLVITQYAIEDQHWTLTDDGTNLNIHYTATGVSLSGAGVVAIDANNTQVPLANITDSIVVVGVGSTDTLTFDLTTSLAAVSVRTSNVDMIYQTGDLIATTGSINLNAEYGITVDGTLQTTSGNISLFGRQTTTHTTLFYDGVRVNATGSITSETGDIVLDATGGVGSSSITGGIWINGGTVSSTGTGANAASILLNGRESAWSPSTPCAYNHAIVVSDGGMVSSVDGDITLEGLGAPAGCIERKGIIRLTNGHVQSTGNGAISMHGQDHAFSGESAVNIELASTVQCNNGNMSISGNFYDEGTVSQPCIYIRDLGTVVSSVGTGEIQIEGIGSPLGTASNIASGVRIIDYALVTSEFGDISIYGENSVRCYECSSVWIGDFSEITSTGTGPNAAKINIHGHEDLMNGITLDAVTLYDLPKLRTVDGDVTILATSVNYGIQSYSEGTFYSTGQGSLKVTADVAVPGITDPTWDYTLIADYVYSPSIRAYGDALIRPRTPGTPIKIGVPSGSYLPGDGVLSIIESDLNNYFLFANSYAFGGDTTGNIDVLKAIFNDPLTLIGYNITIDSLSAVTDPITLTSRAGDYISNMDNGSPGLFASEVIFNGNVSPGGPNTAGILRATANVTFSAGDTLSIDLFTGDNDSLKLQGSAPILTLNNATLQLAEVGYTPTLNDEFVLIDVAGTEAVVGTFAGIPEGSPILVGNNSYRLSYEGGSGNDVTLTFLGVCSPTASSIAPVACGSYTSPLGNVYTASASFTETIDNTLGCDSVISIDLTINNADASVSQNGTTLTADVAGASYQWLDCNNGNAVVNGENGQSFTPLASGEYALEITENGCTEISGCYNVQVITVGLDEIDRSELTIYPNPSHGVVNIQVNNAERISVYDMTGRTIMDKPFTNRLDISSLPAGNYVIAVFTADSVLRETLVVE
ncbi:MAG: T9SS type A sorting domain-containing protein [Flavobacteriales bacterium]|nr:T9SS type A sorting domain-containing protein [Flavobacteriales bacterium]MCB9191706.1 T9SS type A sorting domain-containing protein [Flavobacteriales bacterium]